MIVYGGQTEISGVINQFYSFDTQNKTWSYMNINGLRPFELLYHSMVYDEPRDR